MKLIVGLGNPGKQYIKTRHNIGFMVLDALQDSLAESHGASEWQLSKKFNAEVSGCSLHGEEKLVLAKPMTFMNASGESVQLLTQFYKMKHDDIIVVHDDKDLPLGQIKVERDRGHAGHNGVRSIIDHIGTKDFTRVRVGVASENEKKMKDTAKFVLGRFGYFEKRFVDELIENSVRELRALLEIA